MYFGSFFSNHVFGIRGWIRSLWKKAICVEAYSVVDNCGGSSEIHRNSVYLKEGALIWKRIFQNTNTNLMIHVYDQQDSLVNGYIHILFINKDLFYKTVKENLILFQYVLGPSITPETLLEKLVDPKESFHQVLKGDKVLIGILLGFGTQNALHVSRIENLQGAYTEACETIPLKNKLHSIQGFLGPYRNVLLMESKPKTKAIHLQPSFSYISFEEEIANSVAMLDVSSPKLSKNRPRFIFGKVKHSRENELFIQDLENTQDEILTLLAKPNFLQEVLNLIIPGIKVKIFKKIANENSQLHDKNRLLHIISNNIYDFLCDENESYQEGFMSGCLDAIDKECKIQNFSHYRQLKVIKTAYENIQEADRFFRELKNWTCVDEGKIYYRTIQNGFGGFLNHQTKVLLHCKITTATGDVLIDSWADKKPLTLHLNETIEGFSWGMKGMQEGEVRELWLHPSVAYGIYTTLEKGISLFAQIELLEIKASANAIDYEEIKYLDEEKAFQFLAENNFEEISKNEGYHLGYEIGSHYKKQNYFSLRELIEVLQEYLNKKNLSENAENSDLLNKLHWAIYHNDPHYRLIR